MGASKTTQTTVENKKVDPWAPAVPSLNRGLAAANEVYDQRRNQSFFPGQTYANFSPETQQGLTAMTNRAQAGSDLTRGAQGMINSTLQGTYLTEGNPYFTSMADRITQNVLPSITAQWARAGRGTGNSEVVEAASRGIGDAIAPIAYQNYAQERGNQMTAAGMAPGLAQQDYADMERILGVGQMREAQDQKGITDQMMRYDYDQNRDARALSEFQGYTLPVSQLGQQSSGTSTATTQQQQSPAQTALGLGLMGASMFGTGGMFPGAMSGIGSALGFGGSGLSPGMLTAMQAGGIPTIPGVMGPMRPF